MTPVFLWILKSHSLSVEVLVKALLIMSSSAMKVSPDSFNRIILCAHHTCVVGSAKRDAVWKRVSKCLLAHDLDVIDIVNFVHVLLG